MYTFLDNPQTPFPCQKRALNLISKTSSVSRKFPSKRERKDYLALEKERENNWMVFCVCRNVDFSLP